MPNPDFLLSIEGERVDARSLMCHFQGVPHPGGLAYQLTTQDKDVIVEAKKQFGLGSHRGLHSQKQSCFLSYLFPMIGLKAGRVECRFWANTIDEVELSDDVLILKGVCSPHVSA